MLKNPFPKCFPHFKHRNLEDFEYSYFSSSSSNSKDGVTNLQRDDNLTSKRKCIGNRTITAD